MPLTSEMFGTTRQRMPDCLRDEHQNARYHYQVLNPGISQTYKYNQAPHLSSPILPWSLPVPLPPAPLHPLRIPTPAPVTISPTPTERFHLRPLHAHPIHPRALHALMPRSPMSTTLKTARQDPQKLLRPRPARTQRREGPDDDGHDGDCDADRGPLAVTEAAGCGARRRGARRCGARG